MGSWRIDAVAARTAKMLPGRCQKSNDHEMLKVMVMKKSWQYLAASAARTLPKTGGLK